MTRRAFSLIELVLVMAVLAVAVAVVGPVLSNFFRGRALDSEARRLLSLTRAGQSRAVSEGLPVLLWVDAPARAYGLELETTGRAADAKSLTFSLEENVGLEAVRSSPLPVNGRNLPAIRFLPDGSTDESSLPVLRLSGADGATLWLVRTASGRSYEIRDTNPS
jgi:prepilin-type N-terminal cleavage/methylation domain-containing protein